MKILALDTAANACSVALQAGDAVIERIETAPRRHAATLLPMAEACLAEAGLELAALDAVAFGRGPGSFTGLRIATSVAQGISFGAGLPVLPVSNLAAAAVSAWRLHRWENVLVVFDARMEELYAGAFRIGVDGVPVAVEEERLIAPAALAAPGEGTWHGAGSGFAAWPALAEQLGLAAVDAEVTPLARDLLPLAVAALAAGGAVSAEAALPVYLREQVAWK